MKKQFKKIEHLIVSYVLVYFIFLILLISFSVVAGTTGNTEVLFAIGVFLFIMVIVTISFVLQLKHFKKLGITLTKSLPSDLMFYVYSVPKNISLEFIKKDTQKLEKELAKNIKLSNVYFQHKDLIDEVLNEIKDEAIYFTTADEVEKNIGLNYIVIKEILKKNNSNLVLNKDDIYNLLEDYDFDGYEYREIELFTDKEKNDCLKSFYSDFGSEKLMMFVGPKYGKQALEDIAGSQTELDPYCFHVKDTICDNNDVKSSNPHPEMTNTYDDRKQCKNCGARLEKENKKCPFCSHKV